MNVNRIAKGIVLNFILNIIATAMLISSDYNVKEVSFTLFLVFNLMVISFYMGFTSPQFQKLQGFFVAMGSFLILLFFLFISQVVVFNWELNGILAMIWCFIGFSFAFIGERAKASYGKRSKRRSFRKSQKEAKKTVTM